MLLGTLVVPSGGIPAGDFYSHFISFRSKALALNRRPATSHRAVNILVGAHDWPCSRCIPAHTPGAVSEERSVSQLLPEFIAAMFTGTEHTLFPESRHRFGRI